MVLSCVKQSSKRNIPTQIQGGMELWIVNYTRTQKQRIKLFHENLDWVVQTFQSILLICRGGNFLLVIWGGGTIITQT